MKNKEDARFLGFLILTAWITSGAVGSMIYISEIHAVGHILTIVLFISILVLSTWAYFQLLKEQNRQERILQKYRENFLYMEDSNEAYNKAGKWNLTHLGIMFFAYILCSTPWFITDSVEIRQRSDHLAQSIALSIYSLNFLITSLICIYLKVKVWRDPSDHDHSSYRLRMVR